MAYVHSADLMTAGYATAKDFKTAASFKLQAVIAGEEARPLLRGYLDLLYPRIAKHNPPAASDPLWLSFDGTRERNIGRMVSAFFKNELNIHVTTTTIRSIVETHTAQMLEDGLITPAQREAVTTVNTHSSAITRDHYVRTDLSRTVLLAREAFAGGQAVPVNPPAPTAQPEEWGSNHPDRSDVLRARWTIQERQYLARVYNELIRPETRHRIMALCLKHIKQDPASRPIFHVRHIMSTDRLKPGLTPAMTAGDDQVEVV